MRTLLLLSLAAMVPLAGATARAIVSGPLLALEWEVTGHARAGEVLPVDLWLRNTAPWGMWVLPTLDGSSRGLRFPEVFVYSVEADERTWLWHSGCGNTNPLRDADFVWLAPGERLQLDATWSLHPLNTDWEPLPAGEHALVATYDTTPSLRSVSLAQVSLRKVLGLPWGMVESPVLAVTVAPAE